MAKIVVELSEQEAMNVEAILLDADEEAALRFIREVLRPKLRAKGNGSLDRSKSTGIMT
jgi:hypothetical protein